MAKRIQWIRHHGLQVVVAAAVVVGAHAAFLRWQFVDNYGVVTPGRVYRCSQGDPELWPALARRGTRLVVNLRTREEDPGDYDREEALLAAHGLSAAHLPIAAKLPRERQLVDFLAMARDRGPLLVHCQHGEDRTGMLVAAYRVVSQGWPRRKALAEMRRFRCRLNGEKLEAFDGLLDRIESADRRQTQLTRAEPPPERTP